LEGVFIRDGGEGGKGKVEGRGEGRRRRKVERGRMEILHPVRRFFISNFRPVKCRKTQKQPNKPTIYTFKKFAARK
jgi:hypothetical protein